MTANATVAAEAAANFVRVNQGMLRRDRDAMNEGWDPVEHPMDSELVNAFGEATCWNDDMVDAIIDATLDALGL